MTADVSGANLPPMLRALPILAATLVVAAPASAGTISRSTEGTLVFTAAAGEANHINLGASTEGTAGSIMVADHSPITFSAPGCTALSDTIVNCPATAVRLDLGDGNDFTTDNFDLPSSVAVTELGGAGNDQLTGGDGKDTLDGGDGNDTLDGHGGSDQVLGGNGDDILMGDHYEDTAADVIDGGAGTDKLQDDYVQRSDQAKPPLAMTLAGGADDGRPGEGDDVRSIEDIVVHQGGTLTGTDGPEHIEAFQTLDTVRISGLGGNDDLKTGGGDDTIDGGAGDDQIDAGFGNDTIVAGPGKDVVFGDLQGGDCGPLWCTFPYGNDHIDVRDGEVDQVDCGFGDDTVVADADDVVSTNCETIQRPGAPSTAKTCTVPSVVGLRAAKARRSVSAAGCRVILKGHGRKVSRQSAKAGRVLAAGTVVRLRLR